MWIVIRAGEWQSVKLALLGIRNELAHLDRRVQRMTESNQEHADRQATAIASVAVDIAQATDAIRNDIATLKATNPDVDFSALDSSVTQLADAGTGLRTLDEENPSL